MQIMMNGEAMEVDDNFSINQLVEKLELMNKRIAIELNCEIVPRSQFHAVRLKAGDCVEVVQAIGGG
ncbi:MAG: sulfur carrier protein ThiS [Gammaproteobacteria bacterium]|nr:sulfur carrier protein ThiS [Gammaproteobacteria bacterium]